MPRRNQIRSGFQRPKRRDTLLAFASPVMVQCPTGKKGFPQWVAQAKLDAYMGQSNRYKTPTRIYECASGCGMWHLTSENSLRSGS